MIVFVIWEVFEDEFNIVDVIVYISDFLWWFGLCFVVEISS